MAHEHGLVRWREWSDAAFAEARERDLPVLLDIGAVWCHWCHVMDTGIDGDPDHTGTYSQPDIAALIDTQFVPIKVDTDKRPDINARYNMGGWPSTVFLTPDGSILYGETYVPPSRMRDLLPHIAQLWREQRAEIMAQTTQMREQRRMPSAPAHSSVDSNTVAAVRDAVADAFDPLFGGFVQPGSFAPKFPHPDALLFAAESAARVGEAPLHSLLLKTLTQMAGGGMYDTYAGGFFRYSTTRDWSVPHYEKMLEDNAELTNVYARASVLLNEPALLDVTRSAQNWVLSDLRDAETGAFGGSQDADKEELYYGKTLAERALLPTPFIDRTIYASWNCLMVSALVTRWKLTSEPDILDAAIDALEWLETVMVDFAAGVSPLVALRHCDTGEANSGFLVDQSAYVNAALDLYEATGDAAYRQHAAAGADFAMQKLQDTDNGGFYDVRPDPDALGELSRPRKDMNENADAALALVRLSALTGDGQYRTAAERALSCFVDEYPRAGFFAAGYARAVDAVLRPALHIVIVKGGEEHTRTLQQAAWFLPFPGAAVETLDGTIAKERGFPPAEDGAARAYVCVGKNCLAPVTDADGLRQTVYGALQG